MPEEPNEPTRLAVGDFGLAMSRSFGDFDGAEAAGLVFDPEVPEDRILAVEDEHVILVCSDGVWDVVDHMTAVKLVVKYAASSAQIAAEKLAAKAQFRWQELDAGQIDDITVCLVRPHSGEHGIEYRPVGFTSECSDLGARSASHI